MVAPTPSAIVAPNVAPGGRPVVSIGITRVTTPLSAATAPQAGHRLAGAAKEWPQLAQNIGKLLVVTNYVAEGPSFQEKIGQTSQFSGRSWRLDGCSTFQD
jgi:hypothetical protein